ncbi:MAG TPA: hypothetical protein PK323_00045 [Bacteroidia bacterium]|nr:hypothetical protein [Bacteroidia bacterium]
MKTIKISSIFLLLVVFAQAQNASNYNVVKVNGTLYNATQKQKLSTGTSVNQNDEVEFGSLTNSAFVISKDNGRFIMIPDNSLSATAGTVLKPLSRRTAITTRSESQVKLPHNDLFKYFGKDNFLFLNKISTVWIDTTKMKINENNMLVAKYKNHEGKAITKKLMLEGDKLVMNLDEIFTDKNEDGSNKMFPIEIFYYNNLTKELALKASFTPILANKKEIVNEFKVIAATVNNSESNNSNVIFEEIESFVFNSYGNTNEDELKQFIISNLEIRMKN